MPDVGGGGEEAVCRDDKWPPSGSMPVANHLNALGSRQNFLIIDGKKHLIYVFPIGRRRRRW
jgi:hypothetical protein